MGSSQGISEIKKSGLEPSKVRPKVGLKVLQTASSFTQKRIGEPWFTLRICALKMAVSGVKIGVATRNFWHRFTLLKIKISGSDLGFQEGKIGSKSHPFFSQKPSQSRVSGRLKTTSEPWFNFNFMAQKTISQRPKMRS